MLLVLAARASPPPAALAAAGSDKSEVLDANGTVAPIGTQCDGASLLHVLEAAADRLAAHVDEVNALNVYPVPDGDTGTNLLHTMRTALAHAHTAEPTCSAVAAALAHGALMGARGNSGVILSQIILGLKDALVGRTLLGGAELVAAVGAARSHAFLAVTKPAAGTMLTLLAAVDDAIQGSGDLPADEVLRLIVSAGVPAVRATQGQNPMNRAAGVVDAGARGLWLLFDGAQAALDGHADQSMPVARASVIVPPKVTADSSWAGAYDVQFLVEHPTRAIGAIREEMLTYGADCVLVVGDETVMKVHVHTLHPDEILRIGLSAGRVADVVVEDLDAMSEAHAQATGIVVRPPAAVLALVTVVPGDGFAEVARSLGGVPLRGGATMNPSTEELLDAIRGANASRTLVLPNDRNVVLAARQAATLTTGVIVIESENIAQGMAALVAFDPAGDPAEVALQMEKAVRATRCVELTRAVRDAKVDGRAVREGQALALLDGRVVAHGDAELAVLAEAGALLAGAGLLTLYVGSAVSAERSAAAHARLAAACPSAEIQVLEGGQPHYAFVIQAE